MMDQGVNGVGTWNCLVQFLGKALAKKEKKKTKDFFCEV